MSRGKPHPSDESDALVALALCPGLGPRRIRALLDACGGAASAWEALRTRAGRALWGRIAGPSATEAAAGMSPAARVAAEKEALARIDARIVTARDAEYPKRLEHLPDPPPVLFCRGRALAAGTAVAIVGTRRASENGRQAAFDLAFQLAGGGCAVISGMARGIDAAAHAGALAAGGPTVAVLGCGLDVLYPPQHRQLAARIANAGTLITEFPCGTPPERSHFPRRNRIIAALAAAVAVVEAPRGSGALITVEHALDLGIDVFVVPGDAARESCRGSNELLRDGAKVALDAADIWAELSEVGRAIGGHRAGVIAALGRGPLGIEQIAAAIGTSVPAALALIGELEVNGLVRRGPDRRYALSRSPAARPGRRTAERRNAAPGGVLEGR
ncbi:MAG TPA: DNA-processing protein DprA [Limnochordia bacterium]